MCRSEIKGLFMKVRKLSIHNWRGIQELDVEFCPGVNVLVGENGAGKSSILDLLAIMLSRLIWRIRSTTGTGRMFADHDINSKASETSNTIVVNILGKDVEWRVAKTKKGTKQQTITNLEAIKDVVNQVHLELEKDEAAGIPLAVYYPVNRAVLEVPLRIRQRHEFTQLSAYDQALTGKKSEGRDDFKLFFEWYRNREDIENENFRYRDQLIKPDQWEFPDRQLEAVRSAISALMPGYDHLCVRRSPMRMVLEKNGQELRVDQLSDGEKCLLALVGDLARRLAVANPSLPKPLEAGGVVLIDEIDLHLHPAWQRRIIPKLLTTFPNCQFIVSTHSPQVLSEVKAESIVLLYEEGEKGIKCQRPSQSYGLNANEILESIMGAEPRNVEVDRRINRIFALIDQDEFQEAKIQIEQLRHDVGGSIPDLLKAESMISMLDIGAEFGE